jgi:hypothetical protein
MNDKRKKFQCNQLWLGPESNRLYLHVCYSIEGRCGPSATEPPDLSLHPHFIVWGMKRKKME